MQRFFATTWDGWEVVLAAVVLSGSALAALSRWVVNPLVRHCKAKTQAALQISEMHRAIMMPDGELISSVVLSTRDEVRDIRIRVGRQEAITEQHLSDAGKAVFVCDKDGKNTAVSSSYCHMVNLKPSELMGYGWKNLLPNRETEVMYEEEWRPALDEERYTIMQTQFRFADGEYHDCEVRLAPHPYNGCIEFVGIITPIEESAQQGEKGSAK